MDLPIIVDYLVAFQRDLLQVSPKTSSKEMLVVGRCGHRNKSIIIKDYTLVFDYPAILHRKLLDMRIFFITTRVKIFIVTGDRD
jgi:hypothetical protein